MHKTFFEKRLFNFEPLKKTIENFQWRFVEKIDKLKINSIFLSLGEIIIVIHFDGTGLHVLHGVDGCKVVLATSCDINCPHCIMSVLNLSCTILWALASNNRDASRDDGRVNRSDAERYEIYYFLNFFSFSIYYYFNFPIL